MTESAPTTAAPKSRTVYILLAVFLGAYGVHNFFAGDKKDASSSSVLFFLCVGLIVNPHVDLGHR
jgi:hypothetical protein